jgi:type VI secretion system protein ImpL
MKSILELLKQKALIQLLGILALSALIWYAGPLVAFAGRAPLVPEFNRLLAILAIVLIWTVYVLLSQARAKKTDQQLVAELSAPPVDPGKAAIAEAQEAEVSDLRQKFEEALFKIKEVRSKARRDKRYLYEFPWYIIIGAPGSGKTTALVNSGLKFPLLDRPGKKSVQGIGGTRNCDWFFSEEALFLDTAGRYTTQDSQQAVDAAAWKGFLDLIKKYRPRQPINGVLVTMSMSDLLQIGEDERSQHASEIRKRIQELYKILSIRFPIYMVFTKCDLVAGFNDFFADLSSEERNQVWGETFPGRDTESSEDLIARFVTGFEALLQRLTQRTFSRIQEENDIQRRGLILDFPQQLALLKPAMMNFLYDVFSKSRFDTEPLLRGIYFTSGTQEGTPIDRVLGRLAEAYGFDRQHQPVWSGRGKAYFISRLLKEVVMPEAELAGVDPGVERRRRWLQWAAYGGLLSLSLGVCGLWSVSYMRNTLAIEKVREQVELYQNVRKELSGRDKGERLLLARLNVLQKANDIYTGSSWWMRFGLYQGEKLQSEIQRVYSQLLKNDFLPLVKMRLEQRLRERYQTGKADDTQVLYELLKVYLMFENPSKMDPKLAGEYIQMDWEQNFFREPQIQAELKVHSYHLLSEPLEPIALNRPLITDVRRKLNAIPLALQIFAHLKSEALPDHSSDFRLSDTLGRYGDQVFTTVDGQAIQTLVIPGLYTHRGYTTFFKMEGLRFVKQALEQNWVLENPAADQASDLNRLYDDLQKLYFAEYERMWRNLLNNLKVKKAQGIHQTVQILDLLSAPDTPLRPLLEAVNKNTSLATDPAAELTAAKQPVKEGTIEKAPTRLSQKPQEDSGSFALLEMERHFKELNSLIRGTEKSPPPFDNVLRSLADLRDVMMQIGNAAKSEEQALKMARERMSGAGASDAMKRAQIEFGRLPEPLKGWFQPLTSFGWKLTLDTAKSELNSIWKTEVLAPYRAGLDQRYPLFSNSRNDTTMADFCRFFAPNGILDKYFQNHLKPFVDTSRSQWRQVSMDDQGMSLSAEVLRQFQYAAKIRETFFAGGGATPSVEFELKPLFLDENIDTFRLSIEGQTTLYRHGPPRASKFKWPGPQTDLGVRLTFQTLDGREINQFEEGPWALLRLLDKAVFERTSLPDRFLVTFQQDKFKARFELRANSVDNPFKLMELQSFRCPGSF